MTSGCVCNELNVYQPVSQGKRARRFPRLKSISRRAGQALLLLDLSNKSLRGLSELQPTVPQVSLSTGKSSCMVIGRKKCVSDAGSIRTGLVYISCCIVTFYKPDDAFRITQFQNSEKTLDNQWLPMRLAVGSKRSQF